jgi:hypothetical protein
VGAWGHLAFDNDTACDWAYDLEGTKDLSLVEDALEAVEQVGDEYLDQDLACVALAACEVLARCQGNHGYKNSYTETVDAWVATQGIRPPSALLERAAAVLKRVVGKNSELRELWDEAGNDEWRGGVNDLSRRLGER